MSGTMKLGMRQMLALRLRGHGVYDPPGTARGAAAEAARRVCGLQAQDIFAASLGVRVRSRGASLAEVEQARFMDRSVVWTWAMRGTLHLLEREDMDWLVPLVGPFLVAADRTRRKQLGLDEQTCARGLRVIRRHLSARGPSTRRELGAALQAAGLPCGYPPERHLLYRAALEGMICMGPQRGAQPTFVLLEDWLGRPLRPVPRLRAIARLAERFLAAYAPAAPADLSDWSALPAPLVREAWSSVTLGLAEVTVDGRSAWIPRRRLSELDALLPPSPAVRLLPAFDAFLLGYRDREPVVPRACRDRVFIGGIIRGVILADGGAVGAWKPNRTGSRIKASLDWFGSPKRSIRAGADAELRDVLRFVESPAGPVLTRPAARRQQGPASPLP